MWSCVHALLYTCTVLNNMTSDLTVTAFAAYKQSDGTGHICFPNKAADKTQEVPLYTPVSQ